MNPTTKALAGKVALITGSSRGIGAAIARRFARHGASVAVHGRDPATLALVHAEIERDGGRAIGVAADVTSYAEIETMRLRIERELGPIDILVANAGGSPIPPGPVEEISDHQERSAGMKQRRSGHIVTLSSTAGRWAHARSPVAYAAAKAGIEMLTRDLALQAGPFGIRVNGIAPETILTERNMERIPEPLRQSLVELHPIRRLGTPDDVAGAALFLVSEDSAWMTGVILDVAGGAQ
jgi:3-oxoacyl-[acyl-carrier protein] reductase